MARSITLILVLGASTAVSGCIGGTIYDVNGLPKPVIVVTGKTCPSCSSLTAQVSDVNGHWDYDSYSGEQNASPTNYSETTEFTMTDVASPYYTYKVYHRLSPVQYSSSPVEYGSLVQDVYFPTTASYTDTDGDSLPDSVETAIYHTDPNKKDTDGDGIGDGAEVLGYDWVDYASFGANPRHKDVFYEVDYEEYTENGVLHSWKPGQAVVDKITNMYASMNVSNPDGVNGISVHLVFDTPLAKGSSPCNSTWRDGGSAPFFQKHQNGFHYVYFASAGGFAGQTNGPANGTGIIVKPSRSFVCGPEPDSNPSNDQTEVAQYYDYANFLHEAGGHGLGMSHGGGYIATGKGDLGNCKPNYPSLMNYAYEYEFNTPTNHTLQGTQIQFSRGTLPSLNETTLNEQNSFPGIAPASLAFLGFGQMPWSTSIQGSSMWVDWNRDHLFSTGIIPAVVIRRNPPCSTQPVYGGPLYDHDDAAYIASVLSKTIIGAGN